MCCVRQTNRFVNSQRCHPRLPIRRSKIKAQPRREVSLTDFALNPDDGRMGTAGPPAAQANLDKAQSPTLILFSALLAAGLCSSPTSITPTVEAIGGQGVTPPPYLLLAGRALDSARI